MFFDILAATFDRRALYGLAHEVRETLQMDKIEEFRANAAAALDLAERADAVEEKLRLLEVAQRWFELAMAHWASPEWLDDPDSLPLSANDGRNVLI
jgi:hypothetical protein